MVCVCVCVARCSLSNPIWQANVRCSIESGEAGDSFMVCGQKTNASIQSEGDLDHLYFHWIRSGEGKRTLHRGGNLLWRCEWTTASNPKHIHAFTALDKVRLFCSISAGKLNDTPFFKSHFPALAGGAGRRGRRARWWSSSPSTSWPHSTVGLHTALLRPNKPTQAVCWSWVSL